MAKQKTLWAVLLLWLIMAITTAYSDEGPITKLFFRSGTVMQCDQVWEGVGSNILCKKSRGILAYSADEVDLVKTFGETDAKEIAARYEERIKYEEFLVKPIIVTPEQERWMHQQRSSDNNRSDIRQLEAEIKNKESELQSLISRVSGATGNLDTLSQLAIEVAAKKGEINRLQSQLKMRINPNYQPDPNTGLNRRVDDLEFELRQERFQRNFDKILGK